MTGSPQAPSPEPTSPPTALALQPPARRRFRFRSKVGAAGFVVVLLVVGLALLAPWVTDYGPTQLNPLQRLKAPSAEHIMGTDHLGRDIFTRVVYGGRTSLLVGALVVLNAGVLGTTLGIVAGYYPRLDNVIMRLMDGLMAFPEILLAIALMATFPAQASSVIIVLSLVYAPRVARVARGTVLVVREQSFIEAARAIGCTDLRIMWKHVLPNCLGPLNVQLTFIFAYAILAESALSFIGVGPPPEYPTWGNILSEGRRFFNVAPWMTFFPGAAIMLAVLGLNLLGDSLRDMLDPRLRGTV